MTEDRARKIVLLNGGNETIYGHDDAYMVSKGFLSGIEQEREKISALEDIRIYLEMAVVHVGALEEKSPDLVQWLNRAEKSLEFYRAAYHTGGEGSVK
jgi:hypothetical protein